MQRNRIWLMIHLRGHVFYSLTFVFAILMAGALIWIYFASEKVPSSIAIEIPPVPQRQQPSPMPQSAASCIVPLGGKSAPNAAEKFFNAIEKRFRLAGFRLNARKPGNSSAIIEDREAGLQWMRRKGEKIADEVSIANVGTNSVALTTPYGLYTLYLSRKGSVGGEVSGDTNTSSSSGQSGAVTRLAGAEVAPGSWRFRRDDMMAYFNEIKVRPERIGAVFDTLAPIWYTDESDGKQKIEGYRVEICGEEDFFKAVGFREGDIVREVNGIRMTNRYAAEELIRRFVYGDLHFAHIKMERDGEDILQTYDVEE